MMVVAAGLPVENAARFLERRLLAEISVDASCH
jgi:hypothetical protein